MGSCLRSGRCCTSFGVCVTCFDLIRLSHSGLDPKKIVQFIPEPPDRERNEPAIIVNNTKFLMVLQWKTDRVCLFYTPVGCEIYINRPLLCRTYPFCLKNNQLSDVKSRACPECWMPTGKEKNQYLADLNQYHVEVEEYRKIVDDWNKKGINDFNNFLDYSIRKAKRSKLF